MFRWLRKIRQNRSGLNDHQNIIDDLKFISGEKLLNEDKKAFLFNEIKETIDWLEKPEIVTIGFRDNLLNQKQRQLIFQSIMERIDGIEKSWLWAFRTWKSAIASMMIVVFAFTALVLMPFNVSVTQANKWTFLEDVQGQVFVNRNGKTFSVDKDFILQEGDLLFTEENSFVIIRYLDDSVTRMGPDTSLEIKKLFVYPEDSSKTEILIDLSSGQIWNSVYNLIDKDSRFSVETKTTVANVTNSAAFTIKFTDLGTELMVFENVVDISKKSIHISSVQPVIAGYKAQVNFEPIMVSGNNYDVLIQKNSEIKSDWVTTNLDLDKKHQDKLKKENLELSNTKKTDVVLISAGDKDQKTFNKPELEDAKQKFVTAQKGFIEAQDLLSKSNMNNNFRYQANPLLIQYKTAIREIMQDYENLNKIDAEQADVLFNLMKEEVNTYRKSLNIILPNDKLYPAKDTINTASLLLTRSTKEKEIVLLDLSRGRLYEVQKQIDQNSIRGAESSLRLYLNTLDELLKLLSQSQDADIQAELYQLLEDQIKQFAQLTSIEKELVDKNYLQMASMVEEAKVDSAEKIYDIIVLFRNKKVPFELILEFYNVLDLYFENGNFKDTTLSHLEEILSQYDEYKYWKTTESIKQDDGLDLIGDLESTGEVGVLINE